ncbi:MAG: hypothetical protein LAP87_29510 [Acidobacteriia bacterium]|nr:hypothetical protein [Terriglobia bacterium]
MILRAVPLALVLLASWSFAADSGIPPRADSSAYPAHQTIGGVTIAAAVVPQDRVKDLFQEDLDRAGYVVIEVALYPEPGRGVDVSPDDFRLRMGADPSTVRPVTPQTLASAVRHGKTPGNTPQPKLPSNVSVHNTETIGYESGPYGRRGVYTASEVGVGVGKDSRGPDPAPPPAKSRDRATLQFQLAEMALPETRTSRAVAGFVYFLKPSKKKSGAYEILYFGMDGQGSLTLPGAK